MERYRRGRGRSARNPGASQVIGGCLLNGVNRPQGPLDSSIASLGSKLHPGSAIRGLPKIFRNLRGASAGCHYDAFAMLASTPSSGVLTWLLREVDES